MKHFNSIAQAILACVLLTPITLNAQTASMGSSTWAAIYSGSGSGIQNGFYFSSAASNGIVFTLPSFGNAYMITSTGETQGYFVRSDEGNWNASTFPFSGGRGNYYTNETSGNYYYAGPAIASDSKGNLWFATRRSNTYLTDQLSTTPTAWDKPIETLFCHDSDKIYEDMCTGGYFVTHINTEIVGRKSISLGQYAVSARTDLMTAYGDGLNGEGQLWFCPNNKASVERVTINKGVATGKTSFSTPVTHNFRSKITQYDTNKVLYSPSQRGVSGYSGSTDGPYPIYRGVINGNSITWTRLSVNNYGGGGAIAFVLGGKEFLLYAKSTTSFAVCQMNIGSNGSVSLTEIASNTPYGTVSSSSWVRFAFDVEVKETKANMYIHTPGIGIALFPLNMTPTNTAAPGKPSVSISASDIALGRQDAKITWSAPSGTAPSKYVVMYNRSYVNDAGNTVNEGWTKAGETTGTSFIHEDVKWRQYMWSEDIYQSTYTYKIIPVFNGIHGTESAVSSGVKPQLIANPPVWDGEIREYNGYSKVQLFWKNIHGPQPNCYRVYRDGQLIADNVAAYNYVDNDLVSGRSYSYEIESVYTKHTSLVGRSSKKSTGEIAPRADSSPTYRLTKVYDYEIAASGSNKVVPSEANANFYDNLARYKQGVYKNGYWYIAVRSSGDSKGGGILRLSAGDPKDANDPHAKNGKNILSPGTRFLSTAYSPDNFNMPYSANTAIAMDDEGNVFMRDGDSSDGIASGGNDYSFALNKGRIYRPTKNADGSYSYTTAPIIVDLTTVIDIDEFRLGNQTYADKTSPIDYTLGGDMAPGRCEYLSMSGKMSSADGALLYISGAKTSGVYAVKLKLSGSTVTATQHAYYNETGVNSVTGAPYAQVEQNEHFVIPVEGRPNQFIHQLRSSSYTAFQIDNPGKMATRLGTIYETPSRVNNAGGCTLAFNNELFVITPQNMYSQNPGNIFVGMANRQATGTSDLTNIIPVAQYLYDYAPNSSYSDANGVWLGAEEARGADGNIIDENKDGKSDYAYIYMYVPSVRFAKFKLEPSTTYPPANINLDITPALGASKYRADNDILRYDAVSVWNDVENYGLNSDARYEIGGYEFRTKGLFIDKTGEIKISINRENITPNTVFNTEIAGLDGLWAEVPAAAYTASVTNPSNGSALTINGLEHKLYFKVYSKQATIDGVDRNVNYYSYCHVVKNADAFNVAADKSISLNDFSSYIIVRYQDKYDKSVTLFSEESSDAGSNAYTAYAPSIEPHIGRAADQEWADWDGDHVKGINDGYWDIYYIDLDIMAPAVSYADNQVPPVSYYSIIVDTDYTSTADTPKTINEFYLYDPSHDDAITSTDLAGYRLVTDGIIPGDYEFPDDVPAVKWIERDYVGGTKTPDNSPHPADDGVKDLNKWLFNITANYAATNNLIAQDASANNSTIVVENVPTIIANPTFDFQLNVYPVPATTEVTVKSPEPINSITIHSVSGKTVKTVIGNGTYLTTVAVDNLPSGYYFIKVNNLAPMKIIKK